MKILFILLIIGLFWEHLAFTQPVVRVWGSKDSLAVIIQVEQYLDILDIHEHVYINIGFSTLMPEKLKGITSCISSPEPKTNQIIKVRIDARMNETQQKLVLAHEMIHVKQYVKGQIKVLDERLVNWKGNIYEYKGSKSLRYSPWEHEAYRNDQILADLCTDQSGTPLMAIVKMQ